MIMNKIMKISLLKHLFLLASTPMVLGIEKEPNINALSQQKSAILNVNSITPNADPPLFIASPSVKPIPTFQNTMFSKQYDDSIKIPNLALKPIYQNDFTPLTMQSRPTPVIMQYLPQTQLNDGVQYLQLIPTKPLLVPISPYISQTGRLGHKSENINTLSYSERLIKGANMLPNNVARPYAVDSPGSLIDHYTTNIESLRTFKPNNGLEVIYNEPDLTLNTNEYIPSQANLLLNKGITRGNIKK